MSLAGLLWCFLSVFPALCWAHEEHSCYGPGDVAGIIIAAIVVTLVFVGLALAAIWYRRKNLLAAFGDGCLRGGKDKENTPKSKKKKDASGEGQFAFDNPYFRDDDKPDGPTQDAAEKGHANGAAELPGVGHQPNGKATGVVGANGKAKKVKITNPFSSVFSLQIKKQQRTMDDSCLAVEPERLLVPLRGHDFTGLGFNICGNMRDGIFVKDVLHRGPASESGKIKAGDRIIGVTVSFSKMVYEDALTILSYASPYDVQLELEKATEPANSRLHQGPPTSILLAGLQGKRLGSSSFSAGQRLFHPLYRSQSIDDLTQIGKDGVHSPKRSQSIGLAALHRSRSGHKATEGAEDSRPVSSVMVTGSLNERMLANAIVEEGLCKKALESLRETKAEDRPSPDPSKTKSAVPWSVTKEISLEPVKKESQEELAKKEDPPKKDVYDLFPTKGDKTEDEESLPRKAGKRKAPPPPKRGNDLETEVQVHHTNDSLLTRQPSTDSDDTEKDSVDADSLERPKVNGNHDSEVSEDSLEEEDGMSKKREKKNNKQRKSSSLGDLTNLEEAVNKHSSQLLERAVSLDLQQQSPMSEKKLNSQNLKKPVVEAEIQTFHKLTLVTSTPVSERDRTTLMSDLSRVGVKPPRKEHTFSEGSLSFSDSESGQKVTDESFRLPQHYDADSGEYTSKTNGVVSVQGSQQDDLEVIEISQRELDDVMMSHRQFLLKQAKATGVYSGLNPARVGPGLSFESWSYEDSNNQSSSTAAPVNGNDSSDYNTALDSTHSDAGENIIRSSGITVRMPDGNTTRTVVVSAADSILQHSPPPRLEPPK